LQFFLYLSLSDFESFKYFPERVREIGRHIFRPRTHSIILLRDVYKEDP